MYAAKFNLVLEKTKSKYSLSRISYLKTDDSIYFKDFDENRLLYFQNIPLKYWKLTYNQSKFDEPFFLLTYPTNPEISFPVVDVQNIFSYLNIVDSIIQQNILITFEGKNASFIPQGHPDYDLNLKWLDENSLDKEISHTDLVPGDIFSYKGQKDFVKTIYLGSYFLRDIQNENGLLKISKAKKTHVLLNLSQPGAIFENNDFIFFKNFSKKSLADIVVIEHLDNFDDLNLPSLFNQMKIPENKFFPKFKNVSSIQRLNDYEKEFPFIYNDSNEFKNSESIINFLHQVKHNFTNFHSVEFEKIPIKTSEIYYHS